MAAPRSVPQNIVDEILLRTGLVEGVIFHLLPIEFDEESLVVVGNEHVFSRLSILDFRRRQREILIFIVHAELRTSREYEGLETSPVSERCLLLEGITYPL